MKIETDAALKLIHAMAKHLFVEPAQLLSANGHEWTLIVGPKSVVCDYTDETPTETIKARLIIVEASKLEFCIEVMLDELTRRTLAKENLE